MERDLSNRLRYRNPSRGGEKTIPGNLPIWENNICLYIQPVFFRCSLPKSTECRTSSTFWYLMFYNVILELCPRLFSSPWRLLHSANEEELSQSFKALRKLTLVTISQYYNIMISQNRKITKSQNHGHHVM